MHVDEKIKQGAVIELARRDFFEYCHLKAPNFYKRDRQFLVDICHELQDFITSNETVLVINLPP